MTIYTVIGYRENYYYDSWEDMSRSDLEIRVYDSEQKAIEQIFNLLSKTERDHGPNARSYYDYEVTLLIDGKDEDWWWDENFGIENLKNPFYSIRAAGRKLYDEWKKEARNREIAAKKKEAEKKKRSIAASAAEKTQKEKKLLAELKAKYPDA